MCCSNVYGYGGACTPYGFTPVPNVAPLMYCTQGIIPGEIQTWSAAGSLHDQSFGSGEWINPKGGAPAHRDGTLRGLTMYVKLLGAMGATFDIALTINGTPSALAHTFIKATAAAEYQTWIDDTTAVAVVRGDSLAWWNNPVAFQAGFYGNATLLLN